MHNSLRLTVAAAALALLAFAPAARAQAPGTLTGLWNVSVMSPEGVAAAALALADDGGQLAGILSSPRGKVPVEGARTGDTVTLRFSVNYEGAPLPVVLTAPAAAGDAIEGAADFGGGQAAGTWKAAKADPSGINGVWSFSADDGSGTPTKGHLALIEDAGTVSGRLLIRSRGVAGVVKGTHQDGQLQLTVDATADGAPIAITMPGKVDGGSLSGTFSVADISGRWTAERP